MRHSMVRLLALVSILAASAPGLMATAALASSATWTTTGSMSVPREDHTATVLWSGKVLVAGGCCGLASAEVYDPKTGKWSLTGSMTIVRYQHTATVLSSGKVLVAGGMGPSGTTARAEIYDPATGTWAPTGSMTVPRQRHTATILSSGKVLVAGGEGRSGSLATAELYDPATGAWTATGSMAADRTAYTATPLPNGQVLVAGGYGTNSGVLASAELYHPTTGKWTATGGMTQARNGHTATRLPGGKVLAAGGSAVYGISGPVRSAELYDSVNGTWTSTGSMALERDVHTATRLTTGQVLVAGGFGMQPSPGGGTTSWLSSAELYDPGTGGWATAAGMAARRGLHTASLLPSGDVLVTGGTESTATHASAELFGAKPVHATSRWTQASPAASPSPRLGAGMVFDDKMGKTVLFGGVDSSGIPFADTWTYDGTNWSRISPSKSPGARSAFGMTYDSARGRIVLFGGRDSASNYLGDTWEFDGTGWLQVSPAASPSGRWGPSMVYDSTLAKTIVFGGLGSPGRLNSDTWTYNGTAWSQVAATPVPPARAWASAAFDSVRAQTVLFGGWAPGGGNGSPAELGDTWLFNGTAWKQASPTHSPSFRMESPITFDVRPRLVVMFGGRQDITAVKTTYLADTWSWNGVDWTDRSSGSAPPPRSSFGLAYNPLQHLSTLFGGFGMDPTTNNGIWYGDTWTLGSTAR